MVDAEIIWN